jgi:2-polyprenyl-3-methyl-5-hydroxy-6-metoxy-1,4-benzoquinol methylase
MRRLSQCPVCDSEKIAPSYEGQTRMGFDAARWRIDRCLDCSQEFVNPQPNWEELAPYYASGYTAYGPDHGLEASDDKVVEQARVSGRFRHVEIRSGMRVLDLGCGGGYFIRIASKLGAVVQGIEPSEQGAGVAEAAGLPVFRGTIEEFIARDPSPRFDLITASHVIEHVPDPVSTLSAMASLLSPGGLIWISVPNADCVDSRALKGHWHSAELPIHLMHFTPSSLTETGRRARLVTKSISTYSLARGAAVSIRQTLRYRFLIPRRLSGQLRMIDSHFGPKRAEWMDAQGRGEAILAEFVREEANGRHS